MYRLNTDFQLFFMENQYTCTDCDKQYCHKNAAHGMSEFRCKECSSVFGYETALKRHVRRNTFTYRANYVRHMKTKQRFQLKMSCFSQYTATHDK